eukprot:1156229-Pelagomonas_calceolata.AAC.4
MNGHGSEGRGRIGALRKVITEKKFSKSGHGSEGRGRIGVLRNAKVEEVHPGHQQVVCEKENTNSKA